MPFLELLWRTLWPLEVGLYWVLTFVAIKRGYSQQFPTFICYTSWVAVEGIVLLYMDYAPSVNGNQYFAASSFGAGICAVLRFGIIYEIFKQLLNRYPALTMSGITLFRGATVTLLMIVITLAWLVPAVGPDPVLAKFFMLETTVNILLVGLLVFLFGFSRVFGLTWRSHTFGIALGLGVLGTVMLSTSAIRMQTRPMAPYRMANIVEVISQSTYLFCALVWLAYLLATERPPQIPKSRPPKHDLRAWNQQLQRFLQR